MKQAFERRTWTRVLPSAVDPADLVVDLAPTDAIVKAYITGALLPELIRESDPAVKDWERSAVDRVRNARKQAATDPNTDWLSSLLGLQPEPVGRFPVCGLADINNWDALLRSHAWKQLVENEGMDDIEAPTTLGRIESGLARHLIVRGYINTYLVSLFLAPLAEGELDRLAEVSDRLDKIVGH